MRITAVTNVAVPDAFQVTGFSYTPGSKLNYKELLIIFSLCILFCLLVLLHFALNSDAFTNFTLMQFDATLPSGQRIFHNLNDKKKDQD